MNNDSWWISAEQLDEDQKNAISAPIGEDHFILGPAGSGKTNLLLLRAIYLQMAGFPDIMIIVFTRSLQEYLKSGANKYGISPSKIKTSFGWMIDLLKQYDKNIKLSDDFETRRKQLILEVNELVNKQNITNLHEVILIDEAQDYLPEEIRFFKKVSKNIFAVADTRQKIYSGEDPIETIKMIVDNEYYLRYHYRNGIKICKLADGLVKEIIGFEPLEKTSNYNEKDNPSTAELIECNNLNEQIRKVTEKLELQLKAYPEEYIGVICPRHKELDEISDYLINSNFKRLVQIKKSDYISFTPEKPIIVTTIHDSKGLEFRALHIIGLEWIHKFPAQRKMCYTAITRAKTSLSMYYSGSVPGYFEQAYNNLKRPPKIPNIEDLFIQGGK